MRAQHTAETQNTVLGSARLAEAKRHSGSGSGERSPRKALGLRIGGDEENRKSHDSRRSFSFDPDEIRKGVADIMHKTRKGHHRPHPHKTHKDIPKEDAPSEKPAPATDEERLSTVPNLVRHRPAYLLISPPQGLARNLLTLSFSSPFSSKKSWKPSRQAMQAGSVEPTQAKPGTREGAALNVDERKLVQNTTLAIYGDQDIFLPLKRTREWTSSLEKFPGSQFRAHEVSGAGHFWIEGRVLYVLVDALKEYGGSLLRNHTSEPRTPGT